MGIRLGSENCNLNAMGLGLRLLRLRRVATTYLQVKCFMTNCIANIYLHDMLESFKDRNGHFFFSSNNDDENNNSRSEQVMRGMVNLLRASSVGFPGERVMEEAKAFTSARLKTLLQTPHIGDSYSTSLLKEVIINPFFPSQIRDKRLQVSR